MLAWSDPKGRRINMLAWSDPKGRRINMLAWSDPKGTKCRRINMLAWSDPNAFGAMINSEFERIGESGTGKRALTPLAPI